MSSSKLDKVQEYRDLIADALKVNTVEGWDKLTRIFSDAEAKPRPEIMLDILSTMNILLWPLSFTKAVLNYNFEKKALGTALVAGLSTYRTDEKLQDKWGTVIDLIMIPNALNQTTKNILAKIVLMNQRVAGGLLDTFFRLVPDYENEAERNDTEKTRHDILIELIRRKGMTVVNIFSYLMTHNSTSSDEITQVLTTLAKDKTFHKNKVFWEGMTYLCWLKDEKFRPSDQSKNLALRAAVDNAQNDFIHDFFIHNSGTKTIDRDTEESRMYAIKYLIANKVDISFLLVTPTAGNTPTLATPFERQFIREASEAAQSVSKPVDPVPKPKNPMEVDVNKQPRPPQEPERKVPRLEEELSSVSEEEPSPDVQTCKNIINDLAKLTKDYKESLDNDQVQIHGILDQLQKALAGGTTKDTIETYYQILKNKDDGENTNLQVIQSNKDTSTLLFIAGIAAIFATVVTGILPGLAVMGIVFLTTRTTPMRFFQPMSQSFAEDTEGVKPDYLKENKGI